MRDVVEVARTALLEVTPEATIGALSGQVDEGGAVRVTFAAAMTGYPGWHWTIAVATLEGEEPSALEVELMPGDGALLAPDWVPWSERLADYQAAQEALVAEGGELDADDSADSDEDDDDDDLGSDLLHGGDLDGVDIDIEMDIDDADDDADDDIDDDADDDDSDDDEVDTDDESGDGFDSDD
jgi:hypothetical protein